MEKVVSSLKNFRQRHGHKLNHKKKLAYILRVSSVIAIFIMVVIDAQIIFNFLTGDRTFPRRITASSQTVAEALDAQRTRDRFLILEGVSRYFQNNKTYPHDLSVLVPSYISQLPADPITKQMYEYNLLENGTNYKLCIYFESGSECVTAQTSP